MNFKIVVINIWYITTLITILVLAIFTSQRKNIRKIQYNSMTPALSAGDYVYIKRRNIQIERNCILVFSIDSLHDYIKRVKGVPGDSIHCISENYNNSLENNNKLQSQKEKALLAIPPCYFYVLGDNKTQSYDSNDFGLVHKSSIKGRVTWIYKRESKKLFRI